MILTAIASATLGLAGAPQADTATAQMTPDLDPVRFDVELVIDAAEGTVT